jgi:hypothetical protein
MVRGDDDACPLYNTQRWTEEDENLVRTMSAPYDGSPAALAAAVASLSSPEVGKLSFRTATAKQAPHGPAAA